MGHVFIVLISGRTDLVEACSESGHVFTGSVEKPRTSAVAGVRGLNNRIHECMEMRWRDLAC